MALIALFAANHFEANAQHSIQFDQARYVIRPGESFAVQVRMVPPPADGLFSFGVRVGFPESAATAEGVGTITIPPTLSTDGPNRNAPVVGVGAGFVEAKGCADIFDERLPVSNAEVLLTVVLRDRGAGPYPLSLAGFNTLGPTEQIFVSGAGAVLDQEISFGSAEVVYSDGPPSPPTVRTNSPVTLNRQTGLFEQRVVVSNSGAPISGFRLFVMDLPAGWSLWSAHGTTNGLPHVDYLEGLAAWEQVELRMEFRIRDRNPDGQPRYAAQPAGSGPPPGPSGGDPLSVTARGRLPDGTFLLEFTSIQGRTYMVQYSYDLLSWVSVVPSVTGNGSRTQWIDGGPPKSDSAPDATRERYYRVFLLP